MTLVAFIVSVIAALLLGTKLGRNNVLKDLKEKNIIDELTFYKWKI
jgi:hypothetical protein